MCSFYVKDTIAALATPSGRGGIAVVRISGPLVQQIAKKILGRVPKIRYASFHTFFDSNGLPMDEGIALFFQGPNSFTGEDILELQGHGGLSVVDCLLREILSLGARLAKPGEFSERAFLNDKMDLIQAEAIADLIDASSEEAVRASLRSLRGEFSSKINNFVDELIKLRVFIEASIDFSDEEIDFLGDRQIEQKVNELIQQLDTILATAKQGSLLREGITIVIAGEPNVGKSTLLNRLSGEEKAIVTPIPGTTRDLLHAEIILDGIPLHIIDTAGLRETEDLIEQEGIRRAKAEMAKADFILCMMDATKNHSPDDLLKNITSSAPLLFIRNKIDLTNEVESEIKQNGHCVISISAKEGRGMHFLKEIIKTRVGFKNNMEDTFSARRRHLDALSRAKDFLLNGQEQLKNFRAKELLAEDLRQVQYALNEITGEFTTEDLLGKIFSSFCIGK